MRKKPLFYDAACLFSLIGSSIGFLMMFTATFFFSQVTEKIRQVTNITATEKLSPVYFAFLMGAFGVSLAGVIKLCKLKRSGLYFYICSQLVILFLPVVWLGWNGFSVTNAIFASVFAGVYLFNYRIMD